MRRSPEEEAAIVGAYRRKVPVKEIYREFRISPPTLYEILSRRGVPMRQERPRADLAEILKEVRKGVNTYAEIGQEHGLSKQRIHQIAMEAGIPPRSAGRKSPLYLERGR